MKKSKLLWVLFVVVCIIATIAIIVKHNYNSRMMELKIRAEQYFEQKYDETMIVYETSISDIKVARAYPVSDPEFKFNLIIYDYKDRPTEYDDQYIRCCLKSQISEMMEDIFDGLFVSAYLDIYEFKIKKDDTTAYDYLENLYYNLMRIPTWEDVKTDIKIEHIIIDINQYVNDSDIQLLVNQIKETGIQIDNIQINLNGMCIYGCN